MMPIREEALHVHNELRKLALQEGNDPILVSRMHFSQWADKVDAMFRHIVELERRLEGIKELERQRWESAVKTFGLSRESEYDMGHDYGEDIEREWEKNT